MASRDIRLHDLTVQFPDGSRAVESIDLTLQGGEFVSLVGPSGCGKTTILRVIAGLVPPAAGRLEVNASLQRAFVFQDPTLLPWRTVHGNVRLPLELLARSLKEQAEAVDESLRLVGLSGEDRQKYPRMLSGGMKMRVSLARALVIHPDILLLDEPFAALDDMLRQQLNEELVRIWRRQGWSSLFVTHNVAEAVFMSQRIVVMGGRPGTIRDEVLVPFDYPRTAPLRGEPDFARLTAEVSARLRGNTP